LEFADTFFGGAAGLPDATGQQGRWPFF